MSENIPATPGLSEPFNWLDDDPEQIEAANAEQIAEARLRARETASMIYEVLTKGRGPEFMDWLEQKTIRSSILTLSNGLVNGEFPLSPADWAYVRAGQNSVFEELERQIRIAMAPEPEPTKGKSNG